MPANCDEGDGGGNEQEGRKVDGKVDRASRMVVVVDSGGRKRLVRDERARPSEKRGQRGGGGSGGRFRRAEHAASFPSRSGR